MYIEPNLQSSELRAQWTLGLDFRRVGLKDPPHNISYIYGGHKTVRERRLSLYLLRGFYV